MGWGSGWQSVKLEPGPTTGGVGGLWWGLLLACVPSQGQRYSPGILHSVEGAFGIGLWKCFAISVLCCKGCVRVCVCVGVRTCVYDQVSKALRTLGHGDLLL